MVKYLFAVLMLTVGLSARADLTCVSKDGSDLRVHFFAFGTMMTLHSQELQTYARIAYGIDIGRLEVAKEAGGNPVLNTTPEGFTGLLYAPTAGRPDLVWYFNFKWDKSAQTSGAADASVIDSQGHEIVIKYVCK